MEWNYKREQKTNWNEIATVIRETVSMDEVVRVYAPSPQPRNHRIPCPIHNGTDYNLSFTSKGFCCFVCNASGDQIAFVKAVLGLPTRAEAMRRLNDDLHLNLPIDSPATTAWSAEATRRVQESEKRRAEAEARWEKRESLEDERAALERIINDPVSSIEDLAKAKERIAYVDYQILSLPPEPR